LWCVAFSTGRRVIRFARGDQACAERFNTFDLVMRALFGRRDEVRDSRQRFQR